MLISDLPAGTFVLANVRSFLILALSTLFKASSSPLLVAASSLLAIQVPKANQQMFRLQEIC